MSPIIADNFHSVSEKITKSAKSSGRAGEDVRLVVVTKGQSISKISEVINAGARDLGENYPEETVKKIADMGSISEHVNWHMIGHLQSRKVKFVVNAFSMMHSIDRTSIANEINAKLERPLDVLLEVNLSGEESKGGFLLSERKYWPDFCTTVLELNQLDRLRIKGLMTMPPYTQDPEASRPIFRACRELREFLVKQTGLATLRELSMGTSLDYSIAIEEGATFVRVGEAIMGARDYSKKI